MKKLIMMCLAVAGLTVAAIAQDVPSDTVKGRQPRPKDSVYRRTTPVSPRDTIHKTKPTRPQPGTQNNTGVKPKSGEPNQTPPK